jgi:hypothetical protein
MASREYIFKLVGSLIAAYPYARVGEGLLEVYAQTLGDLPEPLLSAAAMDCLSTCKFLPTVAELREAAARLALGARGLPTALEAWGQVKAQVVRVGHRGEPHFDDPVLARSVDVLGWRDYCLSDVDQEPSWRARFVQIYDQLRAREMDSVRCLPEVMALESRNLEARGLISAVVQRLSTRPAVRDAQTEP